MRGLGGDGPSSVACLLLAGFALSLLLPMCLAFLGFMSREEQGEGCMATFVCFVVSSASKRDGVGKTSCALFEIEGVRSNLKLVMSAGFMASALRPAGLLETSFALFEGARSKGVVGVVMSAGFMASALRPAGLREATLALFEWVRS